MSEDVIKSEGLGTQIDGSHYTEMSMQPVELAYRLNASPCFCKLAKYLTRNKGDRLVNLQKALHVISLEQDLGKLLEWGFTYFNNDSYETIDKYVKMFNDNKHIQKALNCMYCGDYNMAKYHVIDYAASEGYTL